MRHYVTKSQLSLTKVLELIGKPTFFLFTISVVGVVTYLHLLKLFVQQLFGFVTQLNQGIQTQSSQIINIWRVRRSVPLRKSWPTAKMFSRTPINFRVRPGQTLWVLLPCILGGLFYWYILRGLPSVSLLANSTPALTTKIYDRHGTLLYQIYKDENRSLIKLADLPPHLINATIAAEDKNFYHHFGIDPLGIIRAAYNNFVNCLHPLKNTGVGRKLGFKNCSPEGGSTLTQQLIKNTLLTPEKTLVRKLKEVVLSLQTETTYDKNTILEMYFNQVPYGGTAYGIEEAAQQYLGKSAKDLTLSESAFLAGLPIAPTILSPFGTQPYLAQVRQQQVLENMVKLGMITENEKVKSIATPLHLSSHNTQIRAPHFVMYVRDLLVKEFGETVVTRGGLTVTTTLDLNTQEILQNEIRTELMKLDKLNVKNGAGLVISPPTGQILAMVGSVDFFDTQNDGQVNVTLQKRQPGSSIKPITYSLAFLRGLSPSSIIEDSPVCFQQKGSPDYCPKNYDGRFHGKVTLKTALASSYNVPAVKLLKSLGVKNMVDLARSLGITTWEDSSRFGLSLTLGGGEVTMLDLASVYSVFANNGTKVPLTPIISVHGPTGSDLEGSAQPERSEGRSDPKEVEVLSPAITFQINQILSDKVARAPAFGLNSILNIANHSVAVKTGTTNSLRDNWTFGYTPTLLVATWVGNNDNSPMSSVASGITGASPIWSRTISQLLQNEPLVPFTQPENIIKAKASCENNNYDYFIRGTEPKLDCNKPPGQIL